MDKINEEKLVALANEARAKSYCPYSKKAVGAALLSSDGRVFTGANIENAAFSPTVCAERVALFSAVHAGCRDFVAIAVSGGDKGAEPSGFTPCGVCRQVLTEFCSGELTVLISKGDGYYKHTLGELLPLSFGKGDM